VLAYFLQVFLIAQVTHILGATFLHGKENALILTKSVFGYILGDFFTNSSEASFFKAKFAHMGQIGAYATVVPIL
jgi:hypothetical protein